MVQEQKTHLYEWHKEHSNIIPFAGWLMPVWYSKSIDEHMAVREHAGLFDTSHMGRFYISGPDNIAFLQYVTSNNVEKLSYHDVQYSTILNEHGGIRDDIMLYRVDEELFLLVCNASNKDKIWKWLNEKKVQFNISLTDMSETIAMFALQGPLAAKVLDKISDNPVSSIKRFNIEKRSLDGIECFVSRTGYTGEDGFEIFILDAPKTDAGISKVVKLWEKILDTGKNYGVLPCGLGARDTLRLEAGLVLYDHEINEDITPLEARISYAVKFKKPEYIGKEALLKQKKDGIKQKRVGLILKERGIPREHYPIAIDGKEIGMTTSGNISPILKTGIAMGYLPKEYTELGTEVEIKIHNKWKKAEVVMWPFYPEDKYGYKRNE